MLRLEDFMEIQKLHHDGWSVTEIARHLDIDRKTVRKYLRQVILAFWSGPAVEVNFGPPGRVLATLRGWGNESVAG